MRKKLKILSLIITLSILALLLTIGCSKDTNTTTSEEGYTIKIFWQGEQVDSLTLSELQTLPKVSLSAYGKSEEGPTLISALGLAGIYEFSSVTAVGMLKGRIASAEFTLNHEEINDEVILDFTNRGTTKLAGAQIPEDNWIIDVTELRLE